MGIDKLALFPLVKRQVFCVRVRLKMNKHKACNNNSVVAPKLVGSMTANGQMKPTFEFRDVGPIRARPKNNSKAA